MSPRSGVADHEQRPVGRERHAPRLAADGQPAGHLPGIQVDADDLVRHAHGHVSRRAIGRDRHAPRLGTDLDPAGHGDPVVLQVEHRQVVAVPVGDRPAPAVARQGHARRLLTGLDLVQHPTGGRVHQRDRAGRLVGRQQPGAVGRQGQRDRRAMRLVLRGLAPIGTRARSVAAADHDTHRDHREEGHPEGDDHPTPYPFAKHGRSLQVSRPRNEDEESEPRKTRNTRKERASIRGRLCGHGGRWLRKERGIRRSREPSVRPAAGAWRAAFKGWASPDFLAFFRVFRVFRG